jgi:hypothetical protein
MNDNDVGDAARCSFDQQDQRASKRGPNTKPAVSAERGWHSHQKGSEMFGRHRNVGHLLWLLEIDKEGAMLRVVFFCIVILVVPTAVASLNDGDGPVGGKPYSEQLDAANEMFLAELRKRLQQKGYEEVSIVPQMFVVHAKQNGRSVTLIVDSDSLQSLAIGPGNISSCSSAKGEAK